jgi:hypothetical protein
MGVSGSDETGDAVKVSGNRRRKEAMACLIMGSWYMVAAITHFTVGALPGAENCDILIRIAMGDVPAIVAVIVAVLYFWMWRRWTFIADDTGEDSLLYSGLMLILRRITFAKHAHIVTVVIGMVYAVFIVPSQSDEDCVSSRTPGALSIFPLRFLSLFVELTRILFQIQPLLWNPVRRNPSGSTSCRGLSMRECPQA